MEEAGAGAGYAGGEAGGGSKVYIFRISNDSRKYI